MKRDQDRSEQVVQCSGKAEYMAHVKQGVARFATEVVEAPEVYGALCVIDFGESAQIYQLGNAASLRDIQQHIMQSIASGKMQGGPTRVLKINVVGLGVALFGLGVLLGLVL